LQISPDNTKYRQEFAFGERGLYTNITLLLEFVSESHNTPNTSALHEQSIGVRLSYASTIIYTTMQYILK